MLRSEGRSSIVFAIDNSPVTLLPEFPDTEQWQHLAALRQLDPNKGRSLTQLFSAAVIHSHEAGLVVPYRAVPTARFGRMYAAAPSGSKLSRVAGLILFGQTHCELDMVGAHTWELSAALCANLFAMGLTRHFLLRMCPQRGSFLSMLLGAPPLPLVGPHIRSIFGQLH